MDAVPLLWCPEPELNRHGTLRFLGILSPVCLPIPPSGHNHPLNLTQLEVKFKPGLQLEDTHRQENCKSNDNGNQAADDQPKLHGVEFHQRAQGVHKIQNVAA